MDGLVDLHLIVGGGVCLHRQVSGDCLTGGDRGIHNLERNALPRWHQRGGFPSALPAAFGP